MDKFEGLCKNLGYVIMVKIKITIALTSLLSPHFILFISSDMMVHQVLKKIRHITFGHRNYMEVDRINYGGILSVNSRYCMI